MQIIAEEKKDAPIAAVNTTGKLAPPPTNSALIAKASILQLTSSVCPRIKRETEVLHIKTTSKLHTLRHLENILTLIQSLQRLMQPCDFPPLPALPWDSLSLTDHPGKRDVMVAHPDNKEIFIINELYPGGAILGSPLLFLAFFSRCNQTNHHSQGQ